MLTGRFGLLLTVLWLAALGRVGLAQPDAPSAAPSAQEKAPDEEVPSDNPTPPAKAAAPAGEPAQKLESQPSIFWLPRKDGQLQPVVNFPLEEFERLRELQSGTARGVEKPAYSMQMSATGTALENHAKLAIEFAIRVQTAGWVRVPLRLDDALQSESAAYDGPGQHFLTYEEEADGHVAWIEGEPGAEHRLTLQVLAPLTTVGGETRLKLSLPRLPTSRLELTVPSPHATAQAPSGTVLEQAPVGDEGTKFTAIGLGSDFELSWRDDDAQVVEAPIVLEATGSIIARIDGRSVSTEATLRVKSHASEIDRFRVRLPRGAELVTRQQPGYVISQLPADPSAPAADQGRRLVEVRLETEATTAELQLVTEQPHSRANGDEYVDLAGFEVVGAVPQSGHIAVAVIGDWQVVWGDRRNVRQVAELPPALQIEGLASGFEYLTQPCSLLAKVMPRTSRIAVEPDYLLFVEDEQLRLQATFHYTVRGAKVFAFDIEVPEGWVVDEIGPANLVDLFGVVFEQLDPLSIPLLQPATGEVELVLSAHRAYGDDGPRVDVRLPRPLVNSVGPANVVVLPDDNVQLTPNAARTSGLARQHSVAPWDVPARQQEPLYYRGEVRRASLVADVEVRTRQVKGDIASRIELNEEGSRVEQQFALGVRYEPLAQVVFELPPAVSLSDELEFSSQDRPLEWSRMEGTEDEEAPARVVVRLPSDTIGEIELTARYGLRDTPLVPQVTVLRQVPLLMPVDCEIGRNVVQLVARPGIEAQPQGDQWKPATTIEAETGTDEGLLLEARGAVNRLSAAVNLEDSRMLGATWIDRAWLQTWVSDSLRQERAVYRLTSNRTPLEMKLPGGLIRQSVDVWLDGKRVAPQIASGNVLRVDVDGSETQSQVLEVLYQVQDDRAASGKFALVAPQFDERTVQRQTYWQLVLPRDVHLVSAPEAFTRAYQWMWGGLYWLRQPLWEQFELENWVGAPHQTEVSTDTNRYLFSRLGPPPQLEVQTANRAFLVLVASGTSLVVGLLLIYVPQVRRLGVVFGAAVVLVAVGSVYPELTALVSQAACLGLVLVLMAGLLERMFAGRRTPAWGASSSAIVERGSTPSRRVPPVTGSQESTESSPVPVSSSAGEPLP